MLEIYTDGACVPNPGRGGWGFVVYRDDIEIYSTRSGADDTTNNVMEMTAMLEALKWLRQNRAAAKIYSDSQYVVKGCNTWRIAWARNGWYTKQKKLVANREIWREICTELDRRPRLSCSIEWVKGHAGIVGNERADELSMLGAAEAAGVPVEALYEEERAVRRSFGGGR